MTSPHRTPSTVAATARHSARRFAGLVASAAVVAAAAPTAALALQNTASAQASASVEQAAAPAPVRARYVPAGWPTYASTGAKGTLTPMKGKTITRDGTVIKNRLITGQLTIKADNVTLRNVEIRSDDYYGILTYGDGLLIEDATVIGHAPDTLAAIAATGGGSFIADHVEVRGSEDGVRLADNSVLRHSLVHRLDGDSSSHYDAVTADGYTGWRIRHNTILNQKGQTAAVWVGDSRYGGSAGALVNNYLAGGGFTVYSGTGDTSGSRNGIRIVDNVFSTRFFNRSGYYGVVYDWKARGNTWTGNTWIDGSRKGKAVRP